MAVFELRYPTGAAPTSSWMPTIQPLIGGGANESHSGIAGESPRDQRVQWSNRFSPRYWRYLFAFSHLPLTDVDSFENFIETVRGGKFQFKDGCGRVTTFTDVRFPDEGFVRTWRPVVNGTGVRWAGVIVLQDAV